MDNSNNQDQRNKTARHIGNKVGEFVHKTKKGMSELNNKVQESAKALGDGVKETKDVGEIKSRNIQGRQR